MALYGGTGGGGGMGPARRRQLGLTLPGERTLAELQAVNALRRRAGQTALGGPAQHGAMPLAHPALPQPQLPSPFPLPHPVMAQPGFGIPESLPGLSGGPAGGMSLADVLARLHQGGGGGPGLIGLPIQRPRRRTISPLARSAIQHGAY